MSRYQVGIVPHDINFSSNHHTWIHAAVPAHTKCTRRRCVGVVEPYMLSRQWPWSWACFYVAGLPLNPRCYTQMWRTRLLNLGTPLPSLRFTLPSFQSHQNLQLQVRCASN